AAELPPEERLTLALFRFHEGRAQEAQKALFSGPLPEAGLEHELVSDLADRIAGALEKSAAGASKREGEAKQMLDAVLDPDFQGKTPKVAQAKLARLLDDYGDVPLVKQQRAELQKLRTTLEAGAPRDELEFQHVFAPDKLELSPQGRVSLHFDFTEGTSGAW